MAMRDFNSDLDDVNMRDELSEGDEKLFPKQSGLFSRSNFFNNSITFCAVLSFFGLSTLVYLTLPSVFSSIPSLHLGDVQTAGVSIDTVSHPLHDEFVIDCGVTRHDAISRGCIFDIMAAAWTPPLCHNAPAAASALLANTTLAQLGGAGPFHWYRDMNFTSPLSHSLLWTLESEVGYTSSMFHVAHCLYIWRLGVEAMQRVARGERGVWVHFRVVDGHHTLHCANIISNGKIPRDAIAVVLFKVGSCVRLDGEEAIGGVGRLDGGWE